MRALMTPDPSAPSTPAREAEPAYAGADDLGGLAAAVAQNLRLSPSSPPSAPPSRAPAEGPFYSTRDPGPGPASPPRVPALGPELEIGAGLHPSAEAEAEAEADASPLPLYSHELGGFPPGTDWLFSPGDLTFVGEGAGGEAGGEDGEDGCVVDFAPYFRRQFGDALSFEGLDGPPGPVLEFLM